MTRNDDPGGAVQRDEERVVGEYARRASDDRMQRYRSRIEPALRRAQEERRAMLLGELDGLGARSDLRVLDVGCGPGLDLIYLAGVGFAEGNLTGVDVVAERVAATRARLPMADVRLANAARLPFADGSFDAVIQAVSLSSVIDPHVRQGIASEMLRVTRAGGRVVSYDMAVVPDQNPHLVAIGREELERLFGRSRLIHVARLTLFLPIAARVPTWLGRLVGRIPLLITHLHAVVRPDGDEASRAEVKT